MIVLFQAVKLCFTKTGRYFLISTKSLKKALNIIHNHSIKKICISIMCIMVIMNCQKMQGKTQYRISLNVDITVNFCLFRYRPFFCQCHILECVLRKLTFQWRNLKKINSGFYEDISPLKCIHFVGSQTKNKQGFWNAKAPYNHERKLVNHMDVKRLQ